VDSFYLIPSFLQSSCVTWAANCGPQSKIMALGTPCRELTTLWVARLNNGAELKVTDPEEQQGDVEDKEAED